MGVNQRSNRAIRKVTYRGESVHGLRQDSSGIVVRDFPKGRTAMPMIPAHLMAERASVRHDVLSASVINTGSRTCVSTRRHTLGVILGLIAPSLIVSARARQPQPVRQKLLNWVVYYGQTADERLLATYDIVILDPGFLGSLELIKSGGAQIYGYVSLGEVRTTSASYDRLHPGAVLEPNAAWPDVRRVDVREAAWRRYILDEVVASIASAGFDGLMLDTLDTPGWLEQVEPQRYRGMRQAAVDLVTAIRIQYPAMKLIMNRGYDILPEVINVLDAIIAESLLTMPNAEKTGVLPVRPEEIQAQLDVLAIARNASDPLPILSLDYGMADDQSAIDDIYCRELALGHHPYVTTPLVDRVLQRRQHSQLTFSNPGSNPGSNPSSNSDAVGR
jgi:polysaccharide biosynthesis protein PelA